MNAYITSPGVTTLKEGRQGNGPNDTASAVWPMVCVFLFYSFILLLTDNVFYRFIYKHQDARGYNVTRRGGRWEWAKLASFGPWYVVFILFVSSFTTSNGYCFYVGSITNTTMPGGCKAARRGDGIVGQTARLASFGHGMCSFFIYSLINTDTNYFIGSTMNATALWVTMLQGGEMGMWTKRR